MTAEVCWILKRCETRPATEWSRGESRGRKATTRGELNIKNEVKFVFNNAFLSFCIFFVKSHVFLFYNIFNLFSDTFVLFLILFELFRNLNILFYFRFKLSLNLFLFEFIYTSIFNTHLNLFLFQIIFEYISVAKYPWIKFCFIRLCFNLYLFQIIFESIFVSKYRRISVFLFCTSTPGISVLKSC